MPRRCRSWGSTTYRAVFAIEAGDAYRPPFFTDQFRPSRLCGHPGGRAPVHRLFDVLMRRFDALDPHKRAVASILGQGSGVAGRLEALGAAPRFVCSMASAWWKRRGCRARGPCGAARTKGLALVYANAVRAWLRDESADMAAPWPPSTRDYARPSGLPACASEWPRPPPHSPSDGRKTMEIASHLDKIARLDDLRGQPRRTTTSRSAF